RHPGLGRAGRALYLGRLDRRLLRPLPGWVFHPDVCLRELRRRAATELSRRASHGPAPRVARGAGPALAVEVEGRVVDPEAALPRNCLGQRRNRAFVEIFDGPAGGADQVVMMSRLAPDIGRHMTGTLQSLRQPGAHQPVQGPKPGRPPDVRVPLPDALVELLRGGLLAGLREHAGDGEPRRAQPD